MRLRGIELYGFKSFADRTKLTFMWESALRWWGQTAAAKATSATQ